jgi:hypothetical protein
MPDPRLTLLAVGWLEPGHLYDKGPVDEAFFARLIELLVDPWQPFAAGGRHRCGFCRFTGGPVTVTYSMGTGQGSSIAVGVSNLFVPGDGVLYMAPSLVAHYIDAHEYRPPRAFVDAVLACPAMRSAPYLRALHAVGGAKLLTPPW